MIYYLFSAPQRSDKLLDGIECHSIRVIILVRQKQRTDLLWPGSSAVSKYIELGLPF